MLSSPLTIHSINEKYVNNNKHAFRPHQYSCEDRAKEVVSAHSSNHLNEVKKLRQNITTM